MPEPGPWRETLRDFLRSVTTEDETGMVIRVHLYFEQLLGWGLEQHLQHPETLLSGQGLRYNQKVRFCYALGLIDDECLAFLRALGTLRNQFGHKLGKVLTDADVASLVGPLRKELQEEFQAKQDGIQAQGVPMDFPRAKMMGILIGMMPYVAFSFFEDKEQYVSELMAFHEGLRRDWNASG
jgi:hypothetical protein